MLVIDGEQRRVKVGETVAIPAGHLHTLKATTQLFIETPYRNGKMIEDILATCRPQTKLCIAANLTCEGEYAKTRTVKEWRGKVPDLSKIPCIFLLYK